MLTTRFFYAEKRWAEMDLQKSFLVAYQGVKSLSFSYKKKTQRVSEFGWWRGLSYLQFNLLKLMLQLSKLQATTFQLLNISLWLMGKKVRFANAILHRSFRLLVLEQKSFLIVPFFSNDFSLQLHDSVPIAFLSAWGAIYCYYTFWI